MKCREKKRYIDEAAVASLARLNELAYYRCKSCGFFHLTKMAQFGSSEEKEREKRKQARAKVLDQAKRDAKFRLRRKKSGR